MNLVEILQVDLIPLDQDLLRGRSIDVPKAGSRTETRAVDIIGWVVAQDSPAERIEILQGGRVIRRVPVRIPRPDVAAHFPDTPESLHSGFQTSVAAIPAAGLDLTVDAVLEDRRRVPLAVLRIRGSWRGDGDDAQDLVSVVIPCFNQAHLLPGAIESALAQSHPQVEIVVVDDGSTDNTEEVASNYPGVRCVRQENAGLSGARNAGIRHSSGSLLAFLDADDRLRPDAFERHLRCLAEHPEAALVSGQHAVIGPDGKTLWEENRPESRQAGYAALLKNNYIMTPGAALIRRAVLEETGVFDTRIDACADYDLYLRVARRFPIVSHENVVVEYRMHGASMSRSPELMFRTLMRVLRSQRALVRKDPELEEARALGVARARRDFSGRIADSVRERWQDGRRRDALRGLLTLLRLHPAGIAALARPRPAKGRRAEGGRTPKETPAREAGPVRVPEPIAMGWPAACTIATRSHFAAAAALASSFRQHHPEARFYLLAVDGSPEVPLPAGVVLLRPEELPIANLVEMCFQYGSRELCRALKAALLSHLLRERGERAVFFFDSDVLVCRPLEEARRALEDADILLTPRLLAAGPPGKADESERECRLEGAYDLGFLGVRRGPESERFLRWWEDRLRESCRESPAEGLFYDQRWVDYAPALFDSVRLLRDETYGVARWNLPSRRLEESNGTFLVNGRPLALFHFSGLDTQSSSPGGRAESRMEIPPGSALASLCERYAPDRAERDGAARAEYGFSRFTNGTPIDMVMRELYGSLDERARTRFGDPFRAEGPASFFEWAVTPDPERTYLSPFLLTLHRLRPDVAASYPDVFGAHRERFIHWARETGAREMGFDAAMVQG